MYDDNAEICKDKNGKPEANNDLNEIERVPLKDDVQTYFKREISPYIPDAWLDEAICDERDGKIGKVGYEIPFPRYFYEYKEPVDPSKIEKQIRIMHEELNKLFKKF